MIDNAIAVNKAIQTFYHWTDKTARRIYATRTSK